MDAVRMLAAALVTSCLGCSSADSRGGSIETRGPDPQCGGCWVVNAALSGSGDTVFVGGYQGANEAGFVVRHREGSWGTVLRPDRLGGVRQLSATSQTLFLAARDGVRRVDLESFESVALPVDGSAVWASSEDDVFVLDRGTAHHFDGAEWTEQALDIGRPSTLSGTSGSDLYALGTEGEIAHYDGETWSALVEEPPAPLNDIWAASPDTLLAVAGDDEGEGQPTLGRIFSYDGESWELEQEAPDDTLLAVASAGPDRAYAVGGARRGGAVDPVVWRFDGERWTRGVVPHTDAFLWDAWCDDEGACYAAGTDNTFVALRDLER